MGTPALDINYSTCKSEPKLYSLLQKTDPTPDDKNISAQDIDKLSWQKRVEIYRAYSDLTQTTRTTAQGATCVFSPCALFPQRTPPKFQVMLSDYIQQSYVPNTQQAVLQYFDTASNILHMVATQTPEFSPMTTTKTCWPRQAPDQIPVLFYHGAADLKNILQSLNRGSDLKGKVDQTYADAFFLGGEVDTDPSQLKGVIMLDKTKITDLADLYTAFAHEYVGHVFLGMDAHPDFSTDKDELHAFARSVRFLKATGPIVNRDIPELKTFLSRLPTKIQEEETLLKQYTKRTEPKKNPK